jgi:hypothetical protein
MWTASDKELPNPGLEQQGNYDKSFTYFCFQEIFYEASSGRALVSGSEGCGFDHCPMLDASMWCQSHARIDSYTQFRFITEKIRKYR